jgi:hypothetical protein
VQQVTVVVTTSLGPDMEQPIAVILNVVIDCPIEMPSIDQLIAFYAALACVGADVDDVRNALVSGGYVHTLTPVHVSGSMPQLVGKRGPYEHNQYRHAVTAMFGEPAKRE